jgi:hypothetical protein
MIHAHEGQEEIPHLGMVEKGRASDALCNLSNGDKTQVNCSTHGSTFWRIYWLVMLKNVMTVQHGKILNSYQF